MEEAAPGPAGCMSPYCIVSLDLGGARNPFHAENRSPGHRLLFIYSFIFSLDHTEHLFCAGPRVDMRDTCRACSNFLQAVTQMSSPQQSLPAPHLKWQQPLLQPHCPALPGSSQIPLPSLCAQPPGVLTSSSQHQCLCLGLSLGCSSCFAASSWEHITRLLHHLWGPATNGPWIQAYKYLSILASNGCNTVMGLVLLKHKILRKG